MNGSTARCSFEAPLRVFPFRITKGIVGFGIDRSHERPGGALRRCSRLGFHLFLRKEADTVPEALPVGDVPVAEALVAEMGPECDECVVIPGFRYGVEVVRGFRIVLREAFGEVFEKVAADVLTALESVLGDNALDVEEPVFPNRIGVDGSDVIPLDLLPRFSILPESPEDALIIYEPSDDVPFDPLPAYDDGVIEDDQHMGRRVSVGLSLLADEFPMLPEDLADVGIEPVDDVVVVIRSFRAGGFEAGPCLLRGLLAGIERECHEEESGASEVPESVHGFIECDA